MTFNKKFHAIALMIDESNNHYVRAVIPKGTQVEFTEIGSVFKWNSGKHYIYFGRIISGEFKSNRELAICYLLFKYGRDRTDEYMGKLEKPDKAI